MRAQRQNRDDGGMTSTQGSESATGLNAVVGVDGSENSRAALNWALHHVAGHGGGSVRAVMSWTYAPVAAAGYGFGGSLPPAESMEEATKGALDALLETVTAPEGVEVVPVVREGAPSHVVLDEGDGADLIVLGKRGHGGFLGLLIGSVATQVANHASCPVVIVPAHHD